MHIFLTGPNNGNAGTNSTVASASSTTVFTLSSGQGAAYSNGDRVYVVRAAAAAGSLPDETVISGIRPTPSPSAQHWVESRPLPIRFTNGATKYLK